MCHKNRLIMHTVCLKAYRRRGTSLERMVGYGAYPERVRTGERLCDEKQGKEQSRTPL
jgi:hypothetical protein